MPLTTLSYRPMCAQGMRVRMGIHSGIYEQGDCSFNKAAGRMVR